MTEKACARQAFDHWDEDGDGRITAADYRARAHRVIDAFSADPQSDRARAVTEAYMRLWERMAAALDVDKDGEISFAEYLNWFHGHTKRNGDFEEALVPALRTAFTLADADRDGRLDQEEFLRLTIAASGSDRDRAEQAFPQIDTDGDGWVVFDEYIDAIRSFVVEGEGAGKLLVGSGAKSS
ncbi:EF-hand domain-containing protein [Streptomyces ovatisporus]|uniref:EF-hand domain-containing protein n=1 Tax=Streptomyces ovatisporus TaxID=1128682 RepID=A0ABV9A5D1_9ACTN